LNTPLKHLLGAAVLQENSMIFPPTEDRFISTSNTENGAKINEDEVIKVTVRWNDHEESFELQLKSNFTRVLEI
jgi:hypothetical protein